MHPPPAACDRKHDDRGQRRSLRTRPRRQNRNGAAESGQRSRGASNQLVNPGRHAASQERAVDKDPGDDRRENGAKRERSGRTDHGTRKSATQNGHEPMQRSGAPSLCLGN